MRKKTTNFSRKVSFTENEIKLAVDYFLTGRGLDRDYFMSFADIAKIEGIREGSAKRVFKTAILKLQKNLKKLTKQYGRLY